VNEFDFGMQEDFDNMTSELGNATVVIRLKQTVKNRFGQEVDGSTYSSPIIETAIVQPIDEKNEILATGAYQIGDVEMTFKSDSVIAEEALVYLNDEEYKAIDITKVRSFNNNLITHITCFGKKIPKR